MTESPLPSTIYSYRKTKKNGGISLSKKKVVEMILLALSTLLAAAQSMNQSEVRDKSRDETE